MSSPDRILYVCLGNIVRSPLAEHLFEKLAAERGLGPRFEVSSAGTSGYHVGERPDPRMRSTAAKHGLDYDGAARQIHAEDLEDYDLIIAMDHSNFNTLRSMANSPEQEAKLRMLRQFDPHGGPAHDVPDPYYGGLEGFESTYRIVERSLRGLLDSMETGTE